MKDRVPLYPGRVRLTPVSGQENTYDMVRADETTQEGTPLNKATFLKDATAALYGLPNTAVPDDVFAMLPNMINSSAKIETGSYVGTGTYGASNPNSLTFGFAPKFVVLNSRASGSLQGFGATNTPYYYAMFADELSETYKDGYGFSFWASSSSGLSYGKKSADGKTYSWYGTQDGWAQANGSGSVYHYIAIG